MKRIMFIIISTLIVPSIFGSIFESIDSLHRFLDTNDDSIINYISKSMNNHSFCIASPIYIDTTYYAVEIQYSKEKIIGFQTIYAKKNKKRSFFRCGYDNSGNKKYIKGNVDTMQFDIIESWIKKLNIDSLINNDCVMFISKTNLYSFSFIYFTLPLTTDTINKTMGYIDIHRSDSIEFCYFERDYLGSIRAVTDADGRLLQSVDYHVSGNPVVNVVSDRQATNRLHTGKEFQPFQGVALYDNQARYYDPIGSKFLTMDPLCEKYPNLSPYSHCANNPLSIIDPDGRDWYSINETKIVDGQEQTETKYKYTELKSQEALNDAGIEGRYLGEAVVVFNGSLDEKLGNNENIYGEGAKLANVVVYGPKGEDDIKTYKGYTMSSDANKFGVVANGEYNVNKVERKGPFNSVWAINNRGNVPALNGYNPAYPERNPGYLNGVFIHRSNMNGFAGVRYSSKNNRYVAISEGCLLIAPNDWAQFNKQLLPINSFKLIINR